MKVKVKVKVKVPLQLRVPGWPREGEKASSGNLRGIFFKRLSSSDGELTVTDGEVGDCQDHGVAGEDVVPTEILLLAKADSSSHSNMHHLSQDGW